MRWFGRLAPRSRGGAVAWVLAGVLLVAPLAGGAVADSGSGGGGGLGGYTLFADGNGLAVVLDNPVGLGGSHPVGFVGIPEASASLETGPLGRGMGTVIWPGSAIGNAGSLSNVLPIPAQFLPILSQANDPVRAEASTSGPADASYPPGTGGTSPIVMSSHADASKVTSDAAVTGFGVSSAVTVGSIVGHGATTLSATAATASATSAVTGVDVLGGLLHIDSIKSTAAAVSDGTTAKGGGNTVVSGVTVAGQPASIDNTGLHVASSSTGLGGVVDPLNGLVNQALAALSFKAETLKTSSAANGPQDNVLAGGVVITYVIPANVNQVLGGILSNIPQFPNVFQDAVITITIGGATADANAAPAFNFTSPVGSTPVASAGAGSAGSAGSSSSGPGTAGGSSASPTLGSGGSAPAPAALASAPRTAVLSASPIGLFAGVSPGLIALALLGSVLLALGLKRLCTNVLEPKAVTLCPLEQGS